MKVWGFLRADMTQKEGELPWTIGESRAWTEPGNLDTTPWHALMLGPRPAGSVLAVFELAAPGLVTLLGARNVTAALRLSAVAFAERVLPIYRRKHPGDNHLAKIVSAAKLFAVGQASREQVQGTTRPVEQEQKEIDTFRMRNYTKADWGMFSEGPDEEALSTVLAAALLDFGNAASEDVAWFAVRFASDHARRAAALDAEMTSEYCAYIEESLIASVRDYPSEEARRAADEQVRQRHNADGLIESSRAARDRAENAELEWQRGFFNEHVQRLFNE